MNTQPLSRKQRRRTHKEFQSRSRWVRQITALILTGGMARSHAGPAGMTVVQGQATVSGTDQNRTIQVSDRALLNWQNFNIGAKESLTFLQPSAGSVVWNRVMDGNPSAIFGRLEANGIVVLQNSAGWYFGPSSFVSAGGLFVTTTPSLPPDFANGGTWMFSGPPPTASIINYGELKTQSGGSLYLVAEKVENHGTLSSPGGNIGVLAGQEVMVSTRPDGRGLSAQVSIPTGVVDNQGKIIADAGEVAVHARVINQSGLIEANSVREHNGTIELIATEAVNLGASSHITARGDAGEISKGGQVKIVSDSLFSDATGSTVDVSGGGLGGDGGMLEVSAKHMSSIHSTLIGKAQSGSKGGSLLLDPVDIVLGTDPVDSLGSGEVAAGDPPDTLTLDVGSAFLGFAHIALEATHNITVKTAWNLFDSTQIEDPGSTLSLKAGNNLVFDTGSSLIAGRNWSVDLTAGANFSQGGNPVGNGRAGQRSILLNGTAGIEARDGSIKLRAGNDILVETGYIRTIGGGGIDVWALTGSVNAGTKADAYRWTSSGGSEVNLAALGGISTGAGGDVKIKAYKDIVSILPTGVSLSHQDGGSGAFGPGHGDVTLETVVGDIKGHYVLTDGKGVISAGKDAGAKDKRLALSLVKGSWDVTAVLGDIRLQEVRNPQGIFNNKRPAFPGQPIKSHTFNYDLDSSVSLKALNASVQILGGQDLPRNLNESIPSIYPPSLFIEAGAGGVLIGNNVFLYPSPVGQLSVITRDGGDFRSAQAGTVFDIAMSDSTRTRWSAPFDFGPNDSSRSALHANDAVRGKIQISGDVEDLNITLPKPTDFTVGGDLNNTSFVGQNFRGADLTRLEVAGNIFNHNDYAFYYYPVDTPPDLTVFANAVLPADSPINISVLAGKFVYNETLHRLGFKGIMTGNERKALLEMQVRTFDFLGRVIRDEDGNFVTAPATVVDPAVINALYNESLKIPNQPSQGYQIGGPGTFRIRAHNLDLGMTEGIVSYGPGRNASLVQLPLTGPNPDVKKGADLDIQISGDLSMFSSSIQSRAGGNVFVKSTGGKIDAGSQDILGNPETARGIYTAREGDVTVIAEKDINVNGSRIAAYSSGNVFVRSERGNVDAGEGGSGFVRVERVFVNADGSVGKPVRAIPGSGILATAFPGTPGSVGSITVETPFGNILAASGGIAQLAYNGTANYDGLVKLTAGTPEGPNGEPGFTGNIQAGKSGVIGGHVVLKATGDIDGLVVAQGNLDISSTRNVSVTAIAGGNVSVAAAGGISGTIVSAGAVEASGSTVEASLISGNVTATGANGPTAATDTAPAPTAASQAAAAVASTTPAAKTSSDDSEDKQKKKGTLPTVIKTSGRVTVILPTP